MTAAYVTTYCNHAHRLSDGKPIGHECHILPPKALELERADNFDGAIQAIQAAKPLRTCRGVRLAAKKPTPEHLEHDPREWRDPD